MEKANVHMPYSARKKYFDKFLQYKISPEIFFNGNDLDKINYKEIEDISKKLSEKGLKPSVHAPFNDINISASDNAIIEVTQKKLLKTIELAQILNATGIVIHPGYDPFRFRLMEDSWFNSVKKNLEPIIKKAEDCKIYLAIENIFEESFEYLKKLLLHFNSKLFGHCFDTGHFNIFAKTSLENWLENMNHHIISLHLHDNLGYIDQHLPVGDGSFPFKFFFTKLKANLKWVTLEMHNEKSVYRCLQNIKTMKSIANESI